MKKRFIIIFIMMALLIISIIGFVMIKSDKSYDSKAIVGRTISSIIEEYGQFDRVFYDDSGVNVKMGWYIIEERKQTIMGLKDEKYFVIVFENDLAKETYERVGNIGG